MPVKQFSDVSRLCRSNVTAPVQLTGGYGFDEQKSRQRLNAHLKKSQIRSQSDSETSSKVRGIRFNILVKNTHIIIIYYIAHVWLYVQYGHLVNAPQDQRVWKDFQEEVRPHPAKSLATPM